MEFLKIREFDTEKLIDSKTIVISDDCKANMIRDVIKPHCSSFPTCFVMTDKPLKYDFIPPTSIVQDEKQLNDWVSIITTDNDRDKFLVIISDMNNEPALMKSMITMRLFFNGKHLGATFICGIENVKLVPPAKFAQADFFLLHNVGLNQIKLIYNRLGLTDIVSFDEFNQLYHLLVVECGYVMVIANDTKSNTCNDNWLENNVFWCGGVVVGGKEP